MRREETEGIRTPDPALVQLAASGHAINYGRPGVLIQESPGAREAGDRLHWKLLCAPALGAAASPGGADPGGHRSQVVPAVLVPPTSRPAPGAPPRRDRRQIIGPTECARPRPLASVASLIARLMLPPAWTTRAGSRTGAHRRAEARRPARASIAPSFSRPGSELMRLPGLTWLRELAGLRRGRYLRRRARFARSRRGPSALAPSRQPIPNPPKERPYAIPQPAHVLVASLP